MANIANVRIGACSVNWKGNDLGHTLGGVKLEFDRKFTDLKVDKYGDSPVDAALTGASVKISFKCAEPVVGTLLNVLPESDVQIGPTGTRIGLSAGEGSTMRANAGLLTLHPTRLPASNQTEDVQIYLAYPSTSPLDLNYEVAGQEVYTVEFAALVSEAYVAGRRLGHVGPVNIS